MATKLVNAPLRYVLVMMRFPKVLTIADHVGAFQEAIRPQYPLLNEHLNVGMVVNPTAEGPRLEQSIEKLWQFSDVNREFALILGSEFLVLHAGKQYAGHEDFINRFEGAVRAFLSVKGFGQLMTALGYRYIDLVAPLSGDDKALSQYLSQWTMPAMSLDLADDLKLVDSVYVASFQSKEGVLRFQAMRSPPSTLPPDLDTPFVRQNGWLEQRPDGDFALLDLDHATNFAMPEALEPSRVRIILEKLREPLVDLFQKAVTPHAYDVWNRT